MNYELAKQLKDAGFPQGRGPGFSVKETPDGVMLERGLYYPTLSELIEACGDKFQVLWKRHEDIENGWIAKSWIEPHKENYLESLGKNPEEAVAKLWLALNAKQ